jgi:hypothetical protein
MLGLGTPPPHLELKFLLTSWALGENRRGMIIKIEQIQERETKREKERGRDREREGERWRQRDRPSKRERGGEG